MKSNLKNAIYNAIGFIFPVAVGLITTPYILHKLGSEIYGIYVLATSLIGLLSFLDLGFGQGIIKFVSHYEARKEFNKINDIINTTLIINFLMGLVGFVIIFGLSDFLSDKIFRVKKEQLDLSVKAFKIVSLGFLLNLLSSTFSNIPRSVQRYDISVKIQNTIWFLSVISSVILLYMGYGLIQMLMTYVLFQILGLISYFVSSRKLLPFIKISLKFKKDVFIEIFGFSVFTSINAITGNIVFRVDKMIISHYLGTSAVTYYQIPFMIAQMANGFISSIIQFLFPAVSFLNSSGEKERLKEVYKKSIRYVVVLSLIIVSGLILLGKDFLVIWVGSQIAEISYPLLVIISIVFFFISISNVGYFFYNGLGKARVNMISSFVGSSCYLFSAFLLIPAFKLQGAALSFLFILIPFPVYLYYMHRIVEIGNRYFYILLIKAIIIFGIISSLFFVSKKLINVQPSIINFAVMGMLLLIFIFCIIYIMGLLKKDELWDLINRAKKVIV